LIAGTYTPLVLLILPPVTGWTIFFVVWILAILGIVLNAIDLKKFKVISMILYLVMGWCILFSFDTLWNSMNHMGIMLLLLGGVIYTVGAIIYGIGKKKKYMHSLFHIFCLIASVCFFLAIYIYAL
jgi:hemolysin III